MKGVSAVMQSVDGFGFPVLSQSNTTNRTTFAPGRMESIVFASIECKWLPIHVLKPVKRNGRFVSGWISLEPLILIRIGTAVELDAGARMKLEEQE